MGWRQRAEASDTELRGSGKDLVLELLWPSADDPRLWDLAMGSSDPMMRNKLKGEALGHWEVEVIDQNQMLRAEPA